jgi:hypothetical protein
LAGAGSLLARRVGAGRGVSRPVFRLPPPNRTCNFHCIRLSRGWRSLPASPPARNPGSISPSPPGLHQARATFLLQGRQPPGALRPVAGFPGLRLLWHLRRFSGFTGGLSPPFQRSLSRSWLRTLRGRVGGGYRTNPSRSLRNPERRRGRSGGSSEVSLLLTTRATSWDARVRSPPPIVLRHS